MLLHSRSAAAGQRSVVAHSQQRARTFCAGAIPPTIRSCQCRRHQQSTQRAKSSIKAEPEQRTNVSTQQDEEPLWVRREKERAAQAANPVRELPWPLFLLLSAFSAIAAVGSAFEWSNHNPIFGVVTSDSALYTPILGFFALTGIPTAGFLFFKAIEAANKSFELEDRIDGYKD